MDKSALGLPVSEPVNLGKKNFQCSVLGSLSPQLTMNSSHTNWTTTAFCQTGWKPPDYYL